MNLHHQPANRWAVTAYDALRPSSDTLSPIIWGETREAADAAARRLRDAAISKLAALHPSSPRADLEAVVAERLHVRVERVPMGEE